MKYSVLNFVKTCMVSSMFLLSQAHATGPTGTKSDYGTMTQAGFAKDTIKITSDTKYINVQNGDTVEFVYGEKTFTWHFDIFQQTSEFEFSAIAPADFLSTGIKVFVAPDPTFM